MEAIADLRCRILQRNARGVPLFASGPVLCRQARLWLLAMMGLAGVWATVPSASAQQHSIGAPQTTFSDSFFERYALSFCYGGRNFFFNNIGPAPLPFAGGGLGVGGGSSFGFNVGGFSFGFSALQGSNRTITSQSPSLTVTNGAGGSFASGVWRPFVTGWTPVVGEAQLINPVELALARMRQEGVPPSSSAETPPRYQAPPAGEDRLAATRDRTPPDQRPGEVEAGSLSLAELRRLASANREQRQHEAEQEARKWLELARKAESEGKFAVAKAFYERAEGRKK